MNADEAWEEFKKKTQGYEDSQSIQKGGASIPDQLNIISAQLNETINRLDQLESEVDEIAQAAVPSADSADMGMGDVPPEMMGSMPPQQQDVQAQEDPNALIQALTGQQSASPQNGGNERIVKKSIPIKRLKSKTIKKAKKGYVYPGEAWVVGDYKNDPSGCKIFRSAESAKKYVETLTGESKPQITYSKFEFPEIPLITYTEPEQSEPHRVGINISFTPEPDPEPPKEPERPDAPIGIESNKLNNDLYNAELEKYNKAMEVFKQNTFDYETAKARVDFNNKLRYAQYLNAKKNFNIDPYIADRNISALLTQNDDLKGLYNDFRSARSTGKLSDADTVSMYHLLKDYLVKYNKYSGGAMNFKEAPMTRVMLELSRTLKRGSADNNPYINEAIYGTHHLNSRGARMSGDTITGDDLLANMDKFRTKANSLFEDPLDPSNPVALRGMRFKSEPEKVRDEDSKKWVYNQDDDEFPFSSNDGSFNDFDEDTLKNVIKLTADLQPEAVKRAFADALDQETLKNVADAIKKSIENGEDPIGEDDLLGKILTIATPDAYKVDGELSFSSLEDVDTWARDLSGSRAILPAIDQVCNEIGDEAFFDEIGNLYAKMSSDVRDGVYASPYAPIKRSLDMQLAADAFKSTQDFYDALETVDTISDFVTGGKFITGTESDTVALQKLWDKFKTLVTDDEGNMSIDQLMGHAREHTDEYNKEQKKIQDFLEAYRQKAQSETGLDEADVEALGVDLDTPTFEMLDDIDDDIIRDGVIKYLQENGKEPVNAFETLPMDKQMFGTLGSIKNKLAGRFGERGGAKPARTKYRSMGRRNTASEPTEYELMFLNNLQRANDKYLKQHPDAEPFFTEDGMPNLDAVPEDVATKLHEQFMRDTRNGYKARNFDPRQFSRKYESRFGKPIPNYYDYTSKIPGRADSTAYKTSEDLHNEYSDVSRKILANDLMTAGSENPAIGTQRDSPDMSRDEDFNTLIPSWLTSNAVQAYNRLSRGGNEFADSFEDDIATLAYYMSYRDAIKELRYGPGIVDTDDMRTNHLVERMANLRMPIYLNSIVGLNDPLDEVKEIDDAKLINKFRDAAFPEDSGKKIREKSTGSDPRSSPEGTPRIPKTARFYYGRENLTPLTKERRRAVESMLREGKNETGADLSRLERQALEMMLRFNVDATPRPPQSYQERYRDIAVIPEDQRKHRRLYANPDYDESNPDLVWLKGRPLKDDVYDELSGYLSDGDLSTFESGVPISFDTKKLYDLSHADRQDYLEFINNITDPDRMYIKDDAGKDTKNLSPYYIPLNEGADKGVKNLLNAFRLALNEADHLKEAPTDSTHTTIGWEGGKPSIVGSSAPQTPAGEESDQKSDEEKPNKQKPESKAKDKPTKKSVASIRDMIRNRGVGNGVFRY